MTHTEKIQAAAAILRENAEKTTDSAAFVVTITDEAMPAIELTPDRDRIRNGLSPEDIMCRTFYYTDEVVDLSRAFGLHCYITFDEKDNSYRVRIH